MTDPPTGSPDRATPGDRPAPKPPPTGWRLWLAGARLRTLPAAVVPVLVGTAAAAGVPHGGGEGLFMYAPDSGVLVGPDGVDVGGPLKGLIVWRFVAALVVALAIQVGTNYANDYSDGVRGTDSEARVGPLRLVGSGLVEPGRVKRAAFVSFGVAALAGLALAAAVGWWLILVGLVSFAAGWFYTGGPKPYGYAGLGEVFVFVFFGLVATAGSAYVQTGTFWFGEVVPDARADLLSAGWLDGIDGYPLVVFGSAAMVGLLATALLVVNNLRDIPSDTSAGKRTLAVALGDRRTRWFYGVLVVLPFVLVPFVCGLGGRPFGVVALLAVLLVPYPLAAVIQGARGPALIPVLGQTGRIQLAFGVLLAVGLFVSTPWLS